MLPENKNILQLLDQIAKENLLKDLILQINKDAQMVGIDFDLKANSSPINIVSGLKKLLYHLIKNNFSDYVNFLYRIDVSENQLVAFQGMELELLVEKATFLILRKEWQKVCFRRKIQ